MTKKKEKEFVIGVRNKKGIFRKIKWMPNHVIITMEQYHEYKELKKRAPQIKCSHPLCMLEINIGDKYITESSSMGKPQDWHLRCYDRFIASLQEDPTRPHEVEKIQEKYWKNRDNMIKIRKEL